MIMIFYLSCRAHKLKTKPNLLMSRFNRFYYSSEEIKDYNIYFKYDEKYPTYRSNFMLMSILNSCSRYHGIPRLACI